MVVVVVLVATVRGRGDPATPPSHLPQSYQNTASSSPYNYHQTCDHPMVLFQLSLPAPVTSQRCFECEDAGGSCWVGQHTGLGVEDVEVAGVILVVVIMIQSLQW